MAAVALAALFGAAALSACATQTDPGGYCNAKSIVCINDLQGGSTATGGTGNAQTGGSAQTGGTSSNGGASTGGTTANGGSGGSTPVAGSGGTAPVGGSGGTGTTAGSGGTATAGTGGAAGGATGGSGGATAGAGGSVSGSCPAQTSWAATASDMAAADPPSQAIDGDPKTRFSTGTKMLGAEWLQVDLGASATVSGVTVSTANGDYGRHLKIRVVATSGDFAGAVLAEQDVTMSGDTAFTFTPTAGRYVLIAQTGMLTTGTNWWSVNEVTVTCK